MSLPVFHLPVCVSGRIRSRLLPLGQDVVPFLNADAWPASDRNGSTLF